MLSRAALFGIFLYQRWLSPRKGYRCAYSVLHGGTGCSGYAKGAIRDHGLRAALPLVRARFADCRAAFAELGGGDDTGRRRDRWWHHIDPLGCCDGPSRAPGPKGSGCLPDNCDLNPCDANPCDGGGCDCHPCG